MSYFIVEDSAFSVYSSPFAGEDAIRTWIYYVGSGEAKASTNLEFYYGSDEVTTSLKEWEFTAAPFKPSGMKKNVCVYRNPYERFISTYYATRIVSNKLGGTIDDFLYNFEDYLKDDTLKYLFSTQTSNLGPSKEYYTTAVSYRNVNTLTGFFENMWEVGVPNVQLPNSAEPCKFTGRVCEFELTAPQKRLVREIYSEDFENGWS